MIDPSLKSLIPLLSGRRVLVIGDAMIDHYVWGKVERISPEAPIPIVHVLREESKPGGAANVALNVAALGGRVTLAGVIGTDAMSEVLCESLRKMGVDSGALVRAPERPTIQKTRVLAGHQQVVRVDREDLTPLSSSATEALVSTCLSAVGDVDAVLLSDYAKGTLSAPLCASVILKARELGKVIAADPKPANIGWFSQATVVTPNLSEAQFASGITIVDDQSAESAGRALLEKIRCESVLITRGEHGMSLLDSSGSVVHIPTTARVVFDVTGAGDTVIATLTLALAAGASLQQASAMANAAAGIVVGELGVAVVTPRELEQALFG